MAQFLRIRKSGIYYIIRYHATQRYQQNYYEILNVSSDASQDEIKQAFIRLSKQLHPDISGKHSHVDFIKLNEAYSVLGKENIRREYDLNLKYNRYNPSDTHTTQNKRYGSRWEYEVRTAGGPWPPPPPNAKPNRHFGPVMVLFLAFGLTQIIFMYHSLQVRQLTILQNDQIKNIYRQVRHAAHTRCNDQRTIPQNRDFLENPDKHATRSSDK